MNKKVETQKFGFERLSTNHITQPHYPLSSRSVSDKII